ncbi:hypothetical protein CDL15_Pgr011717 [Punica granatum]|uniref:Uncharacterized protein n=1 Tax=Punica granatum TaxID=22663 RepID=A0A218WY68_PUNGR|nr:hypothetical protein CDL15_Pgr011717 [Punica granatum]
MSFSLRSIEHGFAKVRSLVQFDAIPTKNDETRQLKEPKIVPRSDLIDEPSTRITVSLIVKLDHDPYVLGNHFLTVEGTEEKRR